MLNKYTWLDPSLSPLRDSLLLTGDGATLATGFFLLSSDESEDDDDDCFAFLLAGVAAAAGFTAEAGVVATKGNSRTCCVTTCRYGTFDYRFRWDLFIVRVTATARLSRFFCSNWDHFRFVRDNSR